MNRTKTLFEENIRVGLIIGSIVLLLLVAPACSRTLEPTSEFDPTIPEENVESTRTNQQGQSEKLKEIEADALVAAQEKVMTRIYQKVLPSVVNIKVIRVQEGNAGTRRLPEDFRERGEGAGFVWDVFGRIVTNQHVVGEAETVTVIFPDRSQVEAKVLGGDPDSDLAVLELEQPVEGLVPIDLGDSNDVLVGQLAIAIGAPFGQTFTMTSGIVSAVGRTIRSSSSNFSVPEVIQTDAPINPGNSGGPLVNRHGRGIGINTQIISRSGSNAGVGFAVPINIAKMVVPSLIEEGKYEYSWLGISGQPIAPDVVQLMELPEGTQGALVIAVNENSPADEGGLAGSDRTETVAGVQYALGGDTIIGIDGTKVRDMIDLITYLTKNTRPGDQIMLDVIRGDGITQRLSVVLGTRPS